MGQFGGEEVCRTPTFSNEAFVTSLGHVLKTNKVLSKFTSIDVAHATATQLK